MPSFIHSYIPYPRAAVGDRGRLGIFILGTSGNRQKNLIGLTQRAGAVKILKLLKNTVRSTCTRWQFLTSTVLLCITLFDDDDDDDDDDMVMVMVR